MTHTARQEPDIVRRGPLTWGQQAFWAIEQYPSDSPRFGCIARFTFSLPPGTGMPDVLGSLETLFRRHESLRTSYLLDEQVQLVHAPGPVQHEVIGARDLAAAREVATELGERPDWQRFDLEREVPVRVAVVLAGAEPRFVSVNAHHIAADGTSGHVLRDELAHLLHHRTPTLPTRIMQPIDLAAEERTERGRRVNTAALRHLSRLYAAMPNRMFPSASTEPRVHQVTMESPSLAGAARSLGERLGAAESTVLLAAFGTVLGHLSGHECFPMMTTSANRFSPDLRNMVGSLAQHATIGIELTGDPSFTEFVTRLGVAALGAYRHGRYDFMDMVALQHEHAARRGLSFSPPVCFNYRSDVPEPRHPPPAAGDGADPAGRTRLRSTAVGSARDPGGRDLLMIDVHPGAAATVVTLSGNATMLRLHGMRDLLLATEAFLTCMARDPAQPLSTLRSSYDLRPVHEPGWARAGNCWVHLPSVVELLCACPGVESAAADVGEDGLVAYLATAAAPSIEAVHDFVLSALQGQPGVIAPRTYVFCSGVPADPDDLDAWRAGEVVHFGRPEVNAC